MGCGSLCLENLVLIFAIIIIYALTRRWKQYFNARYKNDINLTTQNSDNDQSENQMTDYVLSSDSNGEKENSEVSTDITSRKDDIVDVPNNVSEDKPKIRTPRFALLRNTGTPSEPIKLKVANTEKNCLELKWNKPVDDGGDLIIRYIVEFKMSASEHWSSIQVVNGDVFNAVIGHLKEGMELYFRVIAENRFGQGPASNIVGPVTTKTGRLHFLRHLIPSVRRSSSSRCTLGSRKFPGEGRRLIETTNAFPNADIAEVNNVRETVRESWLRSQGNRKDNAPKKESRMIEQQLIDKDKPGECSDVLVIDWGAGYVKLAWSKPRYEGTSPIVSYKIESTTSRNTWWTCATVTGDCIAVKVDNLAENDLYQFRVTAVNSSGEGTPSYPTEFIKPNGRSNKPSEVVNFSMNVSQKGYVQVTWEKPKYDGGSPIIGYRIEYIKRFSFKWILVLRVEADTKSAVISSVPKFQWLTFRIAAINEAGSGPTISSDQIYVPGVDGDELENLPDDDGNKKVTGTSFVDTGGEETTEIRTLADVTTIGQLVQLIDRHYYKDRVVYFRLSLDISIYNIDLFSLKPPYLTRGQHRSDMPALSSVEDGLLTDGIVDAYLFSLSERYKHFAYANTQLSQTILSDLTVFERENYIKQHALVTDVITHYAVPINIGLHWMLAVVRLDWEEYSILNSARTSDGRRIDWVEIRMERFAQIILTKKSRLTNEINDDGEAEETPREIKYRLRYSGKQWDGYNCGVFVCWYAKQFAADDELNDRSFSPNQFRVEIFKTIASTADKQSGLVGAFR